MNMGQDMSHRLYQCKETACKPKNYLFCEYCIFHCHLNHEIELVSNRNGFCDCFRLLEDRKSMSNCLKTCSSKLFISEAQSQKKQPLFYCKECNMSDICVFCAKNCHSEHLCTLKFEESSFQCNCSKGPTCLLSWS